LKEKAKLRSTLYSKALNQCLWQMVLELYQWTRSRHHKPIGNHFFPCSEKQT